MKFRFLYFALAPFLSSLILIFYFDINPFLDISRYYFQGDGLLSQKYIKNLIINSSFFCSKQLAYPVLDTNCFRDFVLDHLYLNILIIFLIKFFTNDPLLIVLIYDFFCIIFIALITNVVLLKFSISKTLSCLISIFFAVSQNQVNFINQIGPNNFFMVSFGFLMIFWFYNNQVNFIKFDSSKKLIFSSNKYFYIILIMGLCAIISFSYYAYLLLIYLIFAFIIVWLKNGKFTIQNLNIVMYFIIFVYCAFLVCLPTIIFWLKYGYLDIIGRNYATWYYFELSIMSLLLPVENHYLENFGKFSQSYISAFKIQDFELVNFKSGFFAMFGYFFLIGFSIKSIILKKIGNSKENLTFLGVKFTPNRLDLLKFFSVIALLTFLYFSSGGFYRITHFFYSQFRGICRFNLIFTLLGLIFWGIYFDQLIEQQKQRKKQLILKILVT
ncbi:MAG: hypothetical protein ACKO6C_01755, partial [Alphaproteobacteria bacterium]